MEKITAFLTTAAPFALVAVLVLLCKWAWDNRAKLAAFFTLEAAALKAEGTADAVKARTWWEHLTAHLSVSWLAYLLVVVPLVFFGDAADLKNLCWKITVVCVGWIVYDVLRKQMFPFIDPTAATAKLLVDDTTTNQQIRVLMLLGQYILLGALAFATIFGIASGL